MVNADTARRVGSGALVTVLTVTVGMQCLRVLFPIAYSYREAHGLVHTVVIVAVAFLAPVGALGVARRTPRRTALLAIVLALGMARLALQVVGTIDVGLAAVAAAIALAAVVLAIDARDDGWTAAAAVVGGLALDTALRALWGTWDLVWQHGWLPTGVSIVLVASLVASVLALPRDAYVTPGSAFVVLALGPYLALQVLLLQNLAAVAASANVALAGATAIVLLGDGLAVVAILAMRDRPLPIPLISALTIVLALAAWAITGATDVELVALAIVGQVIATMLLARAAATYTATRSVGAQLIAVFVGLLALGATLFLYQLHYDKPLPVSNRWLPVVAALVLGFAALVTPVDDGVPSRSRLRRSYVSVLATVVAALAIGVVSGVAVGEPDPAAASRAPHELTVVTFNVHNAVTRDGQLDPERVARVVERADPDIVVIEEAGRGWPLSSTMDLAEWMKRRLDLPYTWAPAADHTMGNLIFSRVPVRDARVVQLPQGTGTMRRSAAVVRVGPVADRDVTVAGVHLQNGSSSDRKDTRIDELDVLFRTLGPSRTHTVLAGDLNADPGERDLRHVLHAGFTTTQPSRRCTLKTSNDNCVDWILVTDDLEQGSPRVIRVPEFDHNALVSTVSVR